MHRGGGARARGAASTAQHALDEYLEKADFAGALTLAAFRVKTEEGNGKPDDSADANAWRAYAAFHARDYAAALALYEELDNGDAAAADGGAPAAVDARACRAACLYRLRRLDEAEAMAATAPPSPLRTRVLFHVAADRDRRGLPGAEADVLAIHAQLGGSAADQLTLAAVHVTRGHYAEAAETYKRLLGSRRDAAVAANAYLAAAYFKMDHYDLCDEALAAYTTARPLSVSAANLKACAAFRLYNGRAAEAEFRPLADVGFAVDGDDILRHNLVVFRDGEGAARVLPPLARSGAVREARTNLAVHYMRAHAAAVRAGEAAGGASGDADDDDGGSAALGEAWALVRDLAPATPQEHIVVAVVHTFVALALARRHATAPGRPLPLDGATTPREHAALAAQHYHAVGASPAECDTVPGRQAMAAFHMLNASFADAAVYLASIRQYATGTTTAANHGVALAAAGSYAEAADVLAAVVAAPEHACDYTLLSWLARSLIFSGRPAAAWDEYLRLDSAGARTVALLQLIGDDCYRIGAFLTAAKAFDVLERVDPDNADDYAAGVLGAAAGVFQAALASHAGAAGAGAATGDALDALHEVLELLRARGGGDERADRLSAVAEEWLHAAGQNGSRES